jgi:hypothetical protein
MEEWKFADPPNVAVLSDKGIFRSGEWIAYVVHEPTTTTASTMKAAVGNSTAATPAIRTNAR